MELVIIFILCLLATSKFYLQGLFSKKNVTSFSDGLFFYSLIFLFSAIVFIKDIVAFHLVAMVFGIIFGALTVLFQACYVKAMSCGNASLTVLIINLYMVIPMTFSIIFFNEKVGVLRILGIILAFASLALNLNLKSGTSLSRKWLRLCLLASFTNGLSAITQQLFGKTQYKDFKEEFVAFSYLTAMVVSVVIYIILKSKGNGISFKLRPSVFLIAFGIGVILSVYQWINTWAIANIDSTLLFPTYNGGTLILSTIIGVLFLKDKLKTNQIISILLGAASIVTMTL